MSGIEIAIVAILAGAWLLQIWLSSQQMRRFHRRNQELRRMGTHLAIGMSGNMYRRKTYVSLVTDADRRVVAAESLTGFTVFATSKPIPGVVGLSLEEAGKGEPPAEVPAKTWAAIDHAAQFIRDKLEKDAASLEAGPETSEGGDVE